MIYLAAAPVCSGSCARFAVSRRPSQRCRVSAAAHHGCDGSEDAATAGAPGAVALPGGALWWQNLHTSGMQPVYGESFVMQRRAVGGQGLVRRVPQPPPVRHTLPPASPPAVWHAPSAGTGLALAGVGLGSGTVVIDTEFVVLGPSRAAQRPAANTTCVGMVWQPSPQAAAEVQAAPSLRRRRSKHPRRTQMLRFTCNLCNETNDCEVNPHAWSKGSVFARCNGCTAVHKLKDNLRIFTELAGPVFPPRNLRSSYLVQEILDKIQENNRN